MFRIFKLISTSVHDVATMAVGVQWTCLMLLPCSRVRVLLKLFTYSVHDLQISMNVTWGKAVVPTPARTWSVASTVVVTTASNS